MQYMGSQTGFTGSVTSVNLSFAGVFMEDLYMMNLEISGLTQKEFAARSGLGLRFVRELEQGKETVRLDKVNAALAMFDMEAVPGRKDDE